MISFECDWFLSWYGPISLSYNQPQGMYYCTWRSSFIPWIIQLLDQTTSQDLEQPTLKYQAFCLSIILYRNIIFRMRMRLCPSCHDPISLLQSNLQVYTRACRSSCLPLFHALWYFLYNQAQLVDKIGALIWLCKFTENTCKAASQPLEMQRIDTCCLSRLY